jgi:hypothetical protein
VTKQDEATAAVARIEDAAECAARADALVRTVLGRVMAQRRSIGAALDYVKALSPVTRANCWKLAEESGHSSPHRMQALLRSYKWSWERLRGALPALAAQCLPDDADDLIGPGIAVDETAHLKGGRATACAAPQHAGVTGTVENCVTWVFAALVTVAGQAWIDFDVYMPEGWAKDFRRRRRAGIPDGLKFATKPDLAIEQLRRLAASGLRFLWVAADEVYGRSGRFREACRALRVSCVVIVPCDHRVTTAAGTVTRADALVNDAVFERRSCGNGTKGPRYSGRAMIATGREREFLLIRRLDREDNPYTFYLCWAPEDRPATMTYFITIAGRRWPVEVTFKTGKTRPLRIARSSPQGFSMSPAWAGFTWIRRPLRRPRRTCTAASSPRWTLCKTVCRATPRAAAACRSGSQPSGVWSVTLARSVSSSRMCQGAPGVSCSPAMNPSASHR